MQYGCGCQSPALVGKGTDVRTWMACVGKHADEPVRPHDVQRCLDSCDRGPRPRDDVPVSARQEA